MYKIIGKFFDEAIDVSRDVYTNGLPHYHELTNDMWLELRKE